MLVTQLEYQVLVWSVFTLSHGGQLAADTARGTLQMRLSLIQV